MKGVFLSEIVPKNKSRLLGLSMSQRFVKTIFMKIVSFVCIGYAVILLSAAVEDPKKEQNESIVQSDDFNERYSRPEGQGTSNTDRKMLVEENENFQSVQIHCRDIRTVKERSFHFSEIEEGREWVYAEGSSVECEEALIDYFYPKPVMRSIVPISEFTWQRIFKDVDEKILKVVETLPDEECKLEAGNIKTELYQKCRARERVEIAVLMESCEIVLPYISSWWTNGIPYIGVPPDYNKRQHFKSSIYSLERERELRSLDQSSKSEPINLDAKWEINELFYRTAFLKFQCHRYGHQIWRLYNDDSLLEPFKYIDVLWGESARYGDEFALVNHIPRGRDRAVFMRLNPVQTAIQYAKDSEFNHVNRHRYGSYESRQLSESEYRIFPGNPDMNTFKGFLKESGVSCGPPCDYRSLNRMLHDLTDDLKGKWYRFSLDKQLELIQNERLYWALVADSLAGELDIPIDREALHSRFVGDRFSQLDQRTRGLLEEVVDGKVRTILALKTTASPGTSHRNKQ